MDYRNLIDKYGSPLYVYDYDTIYNRCCDMKEFSDNLSKKLGVNVSMHYSTKANGNIAILKIIKNFLKVDAMSITELELVKRAGFDNKDILFVSNNISSDEMKYVSSNDVLMCFDSISQVESFGKICSGKDVMVRINPGTDGVGHSSKVMTSGKATKFGICENNISYLKEICSLYNLNIIGVHMHLGSLFLDDKINNYIEGVKTYLEIIKRNFSSLKIIDFGGGFGIDYNGKENLSLNNLKDELVNVLSPFLKEYSGVTDIKFEPGRYIVCEGGFILGSVTSFKKENNINWIGTDIGMNVLVRPSMYDAYHRIEIISSNKDIISANICGNICESCDVLGRDRSVLRPNIGDIIKVYDAGAYGFSMCSNYTGRLRPCEVLIKDNKDILIRKRDTLEDILNKYVY